jgi:hypothetical protein
MTWVETTSARFRARHAEADAVEAGHLLEALEQTHDALVDLFPRPVGELTLVLHSGTPSLWMARPHLAFAWLATAPAARRYLAGSGGSELHVLCGTALAERASSVPGSREMLERAVPALLVRRMVLANNRELQSAPRPARPALAVRWAWLIDGAARWFAGQTAHARPAIARRLRESGQPRFPPSLRDAPLLGGTVIDLIARERGERAAAVFAGRLHPGGPRAAIARALGIRSVTQAEGEWRSHLARLAGSR